MENQLLNKPEVQSRYDFLDNLRFLLIFCVVSGHLLEISAFPERWDIYLNIYAFHMPALIFLFGAFAKWEPKRILFRWILPYAVFQTLYILFNQKVLGQSIALQYTTPNWILWFMVACIVYQLLMPLYNTKSRLWQCLFLGAAVFLALRAGNDKTLGYYLSLSRITVFMPWFLLGVYFRKNDGFRLFSRVTLWHWLAWAAALVLVVLSVGYMKEQGINVYLLYGSYAYETIKQTLAQRAASMVIALIWLVFLLLSARLLLRWRLPIITSIGSNTLPIFLLHGFAVKYIGKCYPAQAATLPQVLLITAALLLLLGNKWVKKAVNLVTFSWLERFVPYDK